MKLSSHIGTSLQLQPHSNPILVFSFMDAFKIQKLIWLNLLRFLSPFTFCAINHILSHCSVILNIFFTWLNRNDLRNVFLQWFRKRYLTLWHWTKRGQLSIHFLQDFLNWKLAVNCCIFFSKCSKSDLVYLMQNDKNGSELFLIDSIKASNVLLESIFFCSFRVEKNWSRKKDILLLFGWQCFMS